MKLPAAPILFLLTSITLIPLALAQPGNIRGSVIDSSEEPLSAMPKSNYCSTAARPIRRTNRQALGISHSRIYRPGHFACRSTLKGFAAKTVTGELGPGQILNLPQTALAIDTFSTEVTVTQTQVEIAQAQIKAEEQQRLFGMLPNFLATYDREAAPLTAKQKLELTAKTWLDPSSFVINGIIAGVLQAQNTHKGFGQGGQGYAKRYGAAFADYGTSLLLEKVVAPTIFKQDPRYFYKGTGTNRSRLFYAISRTFVCRGDNKQDQFCYSSFVNRFGTGFVTNYYYPAADRDNWAGPSELRHGYWVRCPRQYFPGIRSPQDHS